MRIGEGKKEGRGEGGKRGVYIVADYFFFSFFFIFFWVGAEEENARHLVKRNEAAVFVKRGFDSPVRGYFFYAATVRLYCNWYILNPGNEQKKARGLGRE